MFLAERKETMSETLRDSFNFGLTQTLHCSTLMHANAEMALTLSYIYICAENISMPDTANADAQLNRFSTEHIPREPGIPC